MRRWRRSWLSLTSEYVLAISWSESIVQYSFALCFVYETDTSSRARQLSSPSIAQLQTVK